MLISLCYHGVRSIFIEHPLLQLFLRDVMLMFLSFFQDKGKNNPHLFFGQSQ